MDIFDWMVDRGYVVGYIVGVVAGIWLSIYNRFFNNEETDNSRLVGASIGAIMLLPCLQWVFNGQEIPFFVEFLYLLGGVYLIRESFVGFRSKSTGFRNKVAFMGWLSLLVPFRLVINLIFIAWRAWR
ncbi:MAG: hypothetical protein PHY72_04335 [Candidatus Pacebacteria bacterium]|nr:hypothetical protein [Candidatus Paceibacterota bacterium]